MVSALIDANPERFALVEYHLNPDGYDTPWGLERGNGFYGLASLVPVMFMDGAWEVVPDDFDYILQQRLSTPTDVTISLTGSEVQGPEWEISATVCVEPGGSGKQMRIYTVQLLDHFPADPDHFRNTFRQAADSCCSST